MTQINPLLKSIFVGFTAVALLAGCSEKTTIASGDLSAPTVDDYDNLTNQPEFTLTGKRSPNSIIWYQRVGQTEAVKAVGASEDENWSFSLNLNEGSNRVTITASSSDESVFSDSVQVVVTLDTIAPEPPVVSDHDTNVNTEGLASVAKNLSGTKDNDGSLDLDGTTLVQVDGQTGWTTSVDVTPGVNTFSFTSTDLAGNISSATLVSIAGTAASVGSVSIDDVPDETRQDPYPLTGMKPPETSLWLVQLAAGEDTVSTDPVEIVAENNNTGWTYSLDLGEGFNDFYVYAQNAEGGITAPALESTTLDTIAPDAPVLDEVPESTGSASIQITGTRAADGNLCLRRDQEPTCTPIADIGDTTIDETTALNDGVNFICFSSTDTAGNTSLETCVTVYKLLGPDITILSPEAGSVISTGSVFVEAEVLGGSESGANVAGVQISLDDFAPETATTTGDNWQATLSFAGVENGTLHTITVTATNGVGVESSASLTVLYQSGSLLLSDTNSPGHSRSVSINQDSSGTTHIVWTDECVQFAGCVTYSQSDNGVPYDTLYRKFDSSGWSEILLVSNGSEIFDGDSQHSHSIIDSNGLLHIVWSDTGDSLSIEDYDIFHRTLNTTTGAMGTTQVVANSDKDDEHPILSAGSDGSVHLVWRHRTSSLNHDIYYTSWTASSGWDASQNISNAEGDGDSHQPAIAIDSNGDAHIAWQDNGTIFFAENNDEDIYYRYFDNGELQDTVLISNGGNLGHVGSFDDSNNADSRAPSISISDDDITYIAWHDEAPAFGSSSDFDVFFHAIDSSGNFITTVYQSFDLSNAMSQYMSSKVSIKALPDSTSSSGQTESNVALFWSERNSTNDDNIAFIKATRTGSSSTYNWNSSELVYVSNAASSASNVAVTIDDDNLAHLVWEDDVPAGDDDEVRPNNEGEDFDIFYQAIPIP